MEIKKHCGILLGIGLLLVCAAAGAKEPRVLMWDQMMPPEDLEPAPLLPGEESAAPFAQEDDPFGGWTYGTTPVEELDGQYVKLPGFIVPLESDEGGMLDEFLLVPYFGACIHVPPPPPNQIVYVTLDDPYDLTNIGEPYWIIGTITTKPYFGDIAQTVYQMSGQRVEKYEY
jgi:hypothetical protein